MINEEVLSSRAKAIDRLVNRLMALKIYTHEDIGKVAYNGEILYTLEDVDAINHETISFLNMLATTFNSRYKNAKIKLITNVKDLKERLDIIRGEILDYIFTMIEELPEPVEEGV